MTDTKTTTNKQFAKDNEKFNELCKKAGIPATARQASKFRNSKGRAFAQRTKE
jgi:hypothetical protein